MKTNLLSLSEPKTFSVKKTILLFFFLFLFLLTQSFSQIRMRDRSVWRNPNPIGKSDTTNNEQLTTNFPDTAKHIPEFIVTATRSEKKIDDVGRSVSVISKEDIKNSGANTLADVLAQYEGIYIVGTQQNFGANQSLFMRGANSNQSVVMIDGVPVNDPSTPNGALDLSELSLSDIDHVEIVRGSQSTLYGSAAIGGVINIITTKKMKEGLNINATGTAGSFGKETSLLSENIGMNYTCKSGLYFDMNFMNMNVDGMDATVDTTTVKEMPRDKDGYNRFDYGGKIGFQNEHWDLNAAYKIANTHADIDKAAFTDDPNYTLDFSRKWISYSATYKHDSIFSISIRGGVSSLTRTSLDDSSLTLAGNYDHNYYKGIYTGQTITNEAQMQWHHQAYNFILGVGYNEQSMNQQVYSYSSGYVYTSNLDSLNLFSSTGSVFLLADLNGKIISEKLKAFSISFGGRMNNNNTFGNYSTYQINPMLKLSSTSSLYANISTGYNAPSLYELHSPTQDATSNISEGNVNLRPEKSITKEFGIFQKLNETTWIRIGYFKTVVTDIISYVYLWNKNASLDSLTYNDYRGDTYMNLGTLTSEGIEMSMHAALSKKLILAANFTYLRGNQDFSSANIDSVKTQGNYVQLYDNGKFLTGNYRADGLVRRPVTANLSLTYFPVKKVFCKAVLKYVSNKYDVQYDYALGPYGALTNMPVNSYTLLDLIGGMKFSEQVSGLVRVENVFNVSYSEIIGYTARGRGVYFTVNYTF